MSQKIASLFAEIGANTSGFEKGAAKVKGGLGSIGSELGRVIPPGVLQFASFSGAILAVGDALKTSVDDTLAYAESVRQLSMISGESTENSSRFIQVLDDYKISASDAMVATRALTKEGLAPSIDTLAKLSDQYLSLTSAQEKNEFVLKNLGRGGLQWVEVLNKGSAAIKAQGEAVSDSLILTDAAVKSAREYEIALDNWNDSVQGAKVSVGSSLLPVLTDFTNGINDNVRAMQLAEEAGKNWWTLAPGATKAFMAQAAAEREAATAAMLHGDAIANMIPAYKDYATVLRDTANANSDVNNSLLGLIGSMQGAQESYAEQVASVNADINLSEDERIAKLAELEAEHTRVTNQIILDLMTQKFTADGILDDNELNWLLEKGEAWGIYSATVVAEARTAIAEADKVSSAIAAIPDEKSVTIRVQTLGGYDIGTAGYEHIAHPGRASGGPVMSGYPYIVGERGPEMFVPQSNGNIVPNGQLNQGGGESQVALAAAITSRMPTERGIAKELARELDMRGLARR